MAEILEPKKKDVFSGLPKIVFWIAMFIFVCHACTRMVAAGDTWVAMACGRHFINHGVDTVEPFSFNSHKPGPTAEDLKTWPKWITSTFDEGTIRYWHPTGWVNQNWLTHEFFYWITHLSPFADAQTHSFDTLVYWKLALYIIVAACLYYSSRLLGASSFLAAAFTCFAMYVSRTFLDIRPAGFSNLLVAVYILILVLSTYRNILYIWLLLPLIVLWCNLHGGYLYVFVMIVPYIGCHFISLFFPNRMISIGEKGLYHVIACSAVSFFAMIIFNPFHLTNLTHTFIISFSKNAELWRTVNEWHPAFEFSNPVGNSYPFLALFILCWVVFIVWLLSLTLKPVIRSQTGRVKDKVLSEGYKWPRIDLSLLAIASLTIYMAVRSRRFIPIAAYASAPVLAMLTHQAICMVSAVVNYRKNNKIELFAVSKRVRMAAVLSFVAVIAVFGTPWAIKYYRVYISPWPDDPEFTSVFMRMSASYVKPFYATQFIRDNEISGKMFNYWTEGGFIAYGQVPDPNTGKTPLQLYMDGRAQAAYNTDAYNDWIYIMSGGDPAYRVRQLLKRNFNLNDYRDVGVWVSNKLGEEDVWVVLMPSDQFDSELVRGIDMSPLWKTVFLNNKQKLFVRTDTRRGAEMYLGIYNGQTKFPDEFTKELTKAYNQTKLKSQELAEEGMQSAIKAFELHPSQMPMQVIVQAAQRDFLRQSAIDYCKNFVESFENNFETYNENDGYAQRLLAAEMAANFLASAAESKDQIDYYRALVGKYYGEKAKIVKNSRW